MKPHHLGKASSGTGWLARKAGAEPGRRQGDDLDAHRPVPVFEL